MKGKKFLAGLMTAALVTGLAGCGKTGDTGTAAPGTEQGGSGTGSAAAVQDGESYNIVMEIVTVGENPSGLLEVEQAINDIVFEELGVTVTLYPISVSEVVAQNNMMLTSGEKLDLIFTLGMTGDLANKGMIMPLDELQEKYGADIEKSQGPAMAGGYYGGSLYAIPCVELHGSSLGYLARTDMLDEIGFELEEDKIYSIEELEELFASFKEKYGDGYYCLAGMSSTTDNYASYNLVDSLGTQSSCGVMMGAGLDGNTTIENLYASEEYAAYAQRMYDWAQKGYIAPDAATNTDSAQMQILGGQYLGSFGTYAGDGSTVFAQACGTDITAIPLQEGHATTGQFTGLTWSIPTTCENPEKTYEFLNYLYQEHELDRDVDTILTLGLQNVSWKMLETGEGSRGIMTYMDGVDATSTPYNMALGIYGDKLSQPKWSPLTLDYYDQVAEFNASITDDRKSLALGYAFDSTSVSSQKAAVDSVVSQYAGLISSGSVAPESVLAEFNQALTDAGIDEIIAENQRQLDEWLAQQ